jgi:hypothetical protein
MKQSDLISKLISHAGMKEIIWKEEESSAAMEPKTNGHLNEPRGLYTYNVTPNFVPS